MKNPAAGYMPHRARSGVTLPWNGREGDKMSDSTLLLVMACIGYDTTHRPIYLIIGGLAAILVIKEMIE